MAAPVYQTLNPGFSWDINNQNTEKGTGTDDPSRFPNSWMGEEVS